jgi:short-subunit dehydrogenase
VVLTDKTILVTGSNRGIGRAIAEELAKHPVHLLLGMRDVKAYKPIVSNQVLSVKPVQLDLTSRESIDLGLKVMEADIVKLDILVNNAGIFVAGPLQKQSLDDIYAMFQVNVLGLIQLTNRLLPQLLARSKAKIINNASIAGYAFLPDNSTYSATKAAVVGFSEALRRELIHSNVGVLHLVTPGVSTKMMDEVEATYARNGKPINLPKVSPEAWATKVVDAIVGDKTVLYPSGSTGLLRRISHLRFLVDIVGRRMLPK